MACDTAFRAIVRSCLDDLTANRQATCAGDHDALHEMRVALTRLRAAIAFFSPMTEDSERVELKWLNGLLGATRDMDVAVGRLQQVSERQPDALSSYQSWSGKCADSHRRLAQALRSDRYRRLIKNTSHWVDIGPWCTNADKHAEKQRAARIIRYCTRTLTRWHEKLLKKSHGLEGMGASSRHRLRLANKKLRYAIEFFADLLSDKHSSVHATLNYLRKAQASLGELNDAAQIQTLAVGLQRNGPPSGEGSGFLDRKRERELLRSAARAYRKMDAIKPLCH
jgi:CHAD domain-containing protein